MLNKGHKERRKSFHFVAAYFLVGGLEYLDTNKWERIHANA